ncbi:MAG: HAMP domain-containing protein [Zoogloeaceae bacterium]|jgi:nitrogen fixation/metabolism regulation signal transduction histidine kinase|nr:HAMP domain-containing protein [Zoogloeaceae bacterium]
MKRPFLIGSVLLALGGAALWFLMLASTSADMMNKRYPLILLVNALFLLALLVLLGRQAWRLSRDLRAGIFGSRLKLRLILMFSLVTIIPGMLVYGVSIQFITRSIESWFNVRVEKALESGLTLGRAALGYLQGELAQKAGFAAREIAEHPAVSLRTQVSRLREQIAVDSIALFSPDGQLLASAQRDFSRPLPPLPSQQELRGAQQGSAAAFMEDRANPLVLIDDLDANGGEGAEDAARGLQLRTLIPVPSLRFFEKPRILQLAQRVPDTLNHNAEAVQSVYRDYQELQLMRANLTKIYALTLTLTVLAALFVGFALAFVLARRLSAPLSILAEGTEAVARGDFSPRRIIAANDELGALTQSFNQMTRQLIKAQQETERHRGKLEGARAYLESILANLSAGVLVFDADLALVSVNRGAAVILGDEMTELLNRSPENWPRFQALGAMLAARIRKTSQDRAPEKWQEEFTLTPMPEEIPAVGAPVQNAAPRHLLLRGARLPDISGSGHVVIFDDVTQLIAAQKNAAWGEVAQRLAHEIKNPLTPIQLSAERLQLKLAEHLDEARRGILNRAIETIVREVQALKRMVDDFRHYSRLPPPALSPLNLNALIREVLILYEHSPVRFFPQLASDLPLVAGDANQLRQVIHNLLRNGEEALDQHPHPEIVISTEQKSNGIVLQICDNGAGFPGEILPRIFEPYITTKSRGTGLGLPIVKKIIAEHHGEITARNLPEGGAALFILLPLADWDARDEAGGDQ